jgi:hypothetical protein
MAATIANFLQHPSDRPPDFPALAELFVALQQLSSRLAALEASTPRRGSKQAILRHFGVFRDDDDLEARLADARAQRKARS